MDDQLDPGPDPESLVGVEMGDPAAFEDAPSSLPCDPILTPVKSSITNDFVWSALLALVLCTIFSVFRKGFLHF
jgi:hypothetical protein